MKACIDPSLAVTLATGGESVYDTVGSVASIVHVRLADGGGTVPPLLLITVAVNLWVPVLVRLPRSGNVRRLAAADTVRPSNCHETSQMCSAGCVVSMNTTSVAPTGRVFKVE